VIGTGYSDTMEGVLQAAEDMIDGFVKDHVVEITPDPQVERVWRVQTLDRDFVIYLDHDGKPADFEEAD
jgi:hypothetical protein